MRKREKWLDFTLLHDIGMEKRFLRNLGMNPICTIIDLSILLIGLAAGALICRGVMALIMA